MSQVAERRSQSSKVIQPIVAVVLAIVTLGVPFYLLVITAAKSTVESQTPNLTPPTRWLLFENFASVMTNGEMIPAFAGSLLLLVPSVLGLLILGSMASWILARRSGRTISVMYSIAISGIVIAPAIVTLVLLLRGLGLNGTPLGMIGCYMGAFMSTVIFFVTGFIRALPIELEEAARVDGAGPIRVFFRIILPLLSPVLATASILVCLSIWNDVFYALFIVGGRLDTLPLNLFQVASSGLYQQNWNSIFAYILLMSLPLLIVFFVAQRRIISGITSGAVK